SDWRTAGKCIRQPLTAALSARRMPCCQRGYDCERRAYEVARGEEKPRAARQSRVAPATLRFSAKDKANLMKLAVPDMISNSYFPAEAAVELGFYHAEGLDVSLELSFPVDKAYAALRDGAVDFVGGSARSALAAFPDFRGVKLICAQ